MTYFDKNVIDFEYYINLKVIKYYPKLFDVSKMFSMMYASEEQFNFTLFMGNSSINTLESIYDVNNFQFEKEIPFEDGYGLDSNFRYLKIEIFYLFIFYFFLSYL